MIDIEFRRLGTRNVIFASIGDFYGPGGNTDEEAQARLLAYMQTDTGKKHYLETHPDTDDRQYLAVLYEVNNFEKKEPAWYANAQYYAMLFFVVMQLIVIYLYLSI